jgi:hypothetical protein
MHCLSSDLACSNVCASLCLGEVVGGCDYTPSPSFANSHSGVWSQDFENKLHSVVNIAPVKSKYGFEFHNISANADG